MKFILGEHQDLALPRWSHRRGPSRAVILRLVDWTQAALTAQQVAQFAAALTEVLAQVEARAPKAAMGSLSMDDTAQGPVPFRDGIAQSDVNRSKCIDVAPKVREVNSVTSTFITVNRNTES